MYYMGWKWHEASNTESLSDCWLWCIKLNCEICWLLELKGLTSNSFIVLILCYFKFWFNRSSQSFISTVPGIGFCHTGPISLCIDLFVFICVYFMWFCFILHSCCIIVSVVGWTWWDWSLILMTYLPSVLWHCWLGHLTHKNSSPTWPIMCLVGR